MLLCTCPSLQIMQEHPCWLLAGSWCQPLSWYHRTLSATLSLLPCPQPQPQGGECRFMGGWNNLLKVSQDEVGPPKEGNPGIITPCYFCQFCVETGEHFEASTRFCLPTCQTVVPTVQLHMWSVNDAMSLVSYLKTLIRSWNRGSLC